MWCEYDLIVTGGSYTNRQSFPCIHPLVFFHYLLKTVQQVSTLHGKKNNNKISTQRKTHHQLTYGVKIFNHRGVLSGLQYLKQNARPSSSTSHCLTQSHCNSTTWLSSVPSSLHACNLIPLVPMATITCPPFLESQAQWGKTTSP